MIKRSTGRTGKLKDIGFEEISHRRGEKQGVDAVQQSAVAGKNASGILDVPAAFEHRCKEIAQGADHADAQKKGQAAAPGQMGKKEDAKQRPHHNTRAEPAQCGLPTVFFGLTEGQSLWRPRCLPA